MFFQSFWHNFGYLTSSKLTELIDKPNVTLEEFFEEENIVTDIKQAPQKFADFIIANPDKLKQLIDFCIKEQQVTSEEGSDYNKCLKYPFIASEIFAANPPKIASFLFGELTQEEEEVENNSNDNSVKNSEDGGDKPDQVDEKKEDEQEEKKEEEDSEKKEEQEQEKKEPEPKKPSITGPELLSHLFTFLERDDKQEHFSTSAGYFGKILSTLIQKEGSLWKYLIENPSVKENILKHVDNKSISDIIYKLLLSESAGNSNQFNDSVSKNSDSNNETNIEQKKKMIDDLFVIYQKTDDSEKLENISNIITDLLNASNLADSSQQKLLLQLGEQVYEPHNLDVLVQKLQVKDSSTMQYTAQIINALVQMFTVSKTSSAWETNHNDDDDVQTDESNNFSLQLETLAQKINSLIDAIRTNPFTETQQTSYGGEIVPFGLGRIKVIEIFANLLKCKSQEVYNTIAKSDFYSLLFRFFMENEWNNLLHNQVEKIVNSTIESENTDLIKSMLDQSNMLNMILEGSAANDPADRESTKKYGKPGAFTNAISMGRVGYLTKFANLFKEQISTKNEPVVTYFQDKPEWTEFVEKSLAETNKLEIDRQLGGSNDKPGQESDSDKQEFDVDMQKIYEKFHQYFTNSSTGNNQNNNDDKDDIEEEELDKQQEQEQEKEQEKTLISQQPAPANWVEAEKVNDSFNSASFWKMDFQYNSDDIDALLN